MGMLAGLEEKFDIMLNNYDIIDFVLTIKQKKFFKNKILKLSKWKIKFIYLILQ